jgi:hypothetical protein
VAQSLAPIDLCRIQLSLPDRAQDHAEITGNSEVTQAAIALGLFLHGI